MSISQGVCRQGDVRVVHACGTVWYLSSHLSLPQTVTMHLTRIKSLLAVNKEAIIGYFRVSFWIIYHRYIYIAIKYLYIYIWEVKLPIKLYVSHIRSDVSPAMLNCINISDTFSMLCGSFLGHDLTYFDYYYILCSVDGTIIQIC